MDGRFGFLTLGGRTNRGLTLALLMTLGGCAIEDRAESTADESDAHPTAFTQTQGWTNEDPVRPRTVPAERPAPVEKSRDQAPKVSNARR